jgi:hypothetical protein
MLTDFEVAKYRPFLDSTRIELRPLTLVYGRNAAGKSALVRALPMIAGALQGRGPEPLDLGVAALRGSSYRELTSHFSASGELELGCWWSNHSGARQSLWAKLKGIGPQLDRQLVARLILKGDVEVTHEFNWEDPSNKAAEFVGLLPKAYLDALVELRSTTVAWLGPNRPAPDATSEGYGPLGITPDGSGCRRLLAESKSTNSELLPRVSAALQRVVGQQLDVLLHTTIDAFTVRAGVSVSQGPMVRLSNTGEGVSHVLPVLVALEVGEKEASPDHIVIEQPELHLHPHAECELGKLMAQAAQRPGGPHYLVETHSENLLLGVQLAVVQKRLEPEHVLVYFVTQDDAGRSRAQRVELDERGEPDGTIPQPFGEGLALARSLIEARRGF